MEKYPIRALTYLTMLTFTIELLVTLCETSGQMSGQSMSKKHLSYSMNWFTSTIWLLNLMLKPIG